MPSEIDARELGRVFSVKKELNVFICCVIGAFPAMGLMIVILFVIICVMALFAMNMIALELYEGTRWADDMDAETRLCSLSTLMRTILTILLLGVWGDVVMPCYFVLLQLVMFFIAYINITTLGVTNVVVAVATETHWLQISRPKMRSWRVRASHDETHHHAR